MTCLSLRLSLCGSEIENGNQNHIFGRACCTTLLFRAEIFRNAKTQIVRDFSYLREFPSLWFGDVRIADVLLLELSYLELAVWFPLLAHVQNGVNY